MRDRLIKESGTIEKKGESEKCTKVWNKRLNGE
jgi:hypothetical protein